MYIMTATGKDAVYQNPFKIEERSNHGLIYYDFFSRGFLRQYSYGIICGFRKFQRCPGQLVDSRRPVNRGPYCLRMSPKKLIPGKVMEVNYGRVERR